MAFPTERSCTDLLSEVHGSSQFMQCTKPDCEAGIWPAGDLKVTFSTETFLAEGELPKCKTCNNLARPNVLMFGDYGWLDDRHVRQASVGLL